MWRILKALLAGIGLFVCAVLVIIISKIVAAVSFEIFGWWSAAAVSIGMLAGFSALAYSGGGDDAET